MDATITVGQRDRVHLMHDAWIDDAERRPGHALHTHAGQQPCCALLIDPTLHLLGSRHTLSRGL